MTEKHFLHQLRRGLGSAIVELYENPNRDKYRDIVLRCCLKDIGYDIQVEGTKGDYLYSAICALNAKDEFEDIIINAFLKRLKHNLFRQLADILWLYVDDGSEKARNAFHVKYQNLMERLLTQREFPLKLCEREQFEYLMIWEVDTHNWSGFKKCVADAGRIIKNRNDDDCSCYDWFLLHSENIFSKKRMSQYFDTFSKKSDEVKAFVEAINELEKIRESNSYLRIESEITLENYISQAKELAENENTYTRMWFFAMRFSSQAQQDDLHKLVHIIAAEQSEEVRANLLSVFGRTDFPADIDLLIKYAESYHGRMLDVAVDALKRFKDPRVHELAIKFMTAGNLDAGLPLLIKNWRKQDEIIIRERVLSSKKVTHSIQQDLRDIYSEHRSKSCGDILEHVYRNGECTFCRFGIVQAMWKSRVLKVNILNECLYDSYDETRKIAKRIIRYHG